jgi:hypothetical protein
MLDVMEGIPKRVDCLPLPPNKKNHRKKEAML